MTQINVRVDGASYTDDVEPRTLLVHYLREQLGKVGTVVGCDTSNCGACTVHLNGQSVKSCSVLAVQADGAEITTIEGLARDNPNPTEDEVREGIEGNLCRCTGYQNIVRAVQQAAGELRGAAQSTPETTGAQA